MNEKVRKYTVTFQVYHKIVQEIFVSVDDDKGAKIEEARAGRLDGDRCR